VNGILIASRGWNFPGVCTKSHTQHPFGNGVTRLPGTWDGVCANCKWKEQSSQCSVRRPNEARFIPPPAVPLPAPSRVEEIVDSSDDEDDDSDNGNDGDDGDDGDNGDNGDDGDDGDDSDNGSSNKEGSNALVQRPKRKRTA
jgi:hypothetical protein